MLSNTRLGTLLTQVSPLTPVKRDQRSCTNTIHGFLAAELYSSLVVISSRDNKANTAPCLVRAVSRGTYCIANACARLHALPSQLCLARNTDGQLRTVLQKTRQSCRLIYGKYGIRFVYTIRYTESTPSMTLRKAL